MNKDLGSDELEDNDNNANTGPAMCGMLCEEVHISSPSLPLPNLQVRRSQLEGLSNFCHKRHFLLSYMLQCLSNKNAWDTNLLPKELKNLYTQEFFEETQENIIIIDFLDVWQFLKSPHSFFHPLFHNSTYFRQHLTVLQASFELTSVPGWPPSHIILSTVVRGMCLYAQFLFPFNELSI